MTPAPITLAQQASVQLQVAVLDGDGVLLTGVPVTFATDSAALVTVSNIGLVRSVGPAGATAIRVRAGDVSTSVPVTVTATGNQIRLLPSPAVVAQLQTLQLDVALLDLVGTPVPGTTFTFVSSNPSIATVSTTGLVTSLGPAGQVTITASAAGISSQIQLAVTQVPTTLELLPSSVTMGRNSSIQLTASLLDAVGQPMSTAGVIYGASPASLLSVTAGGLLSGKGSAGTGSASATLGSLAATVPVTLVDVATLVGTIVATANVTGAPYGVILGQSDAVLGVGISGAFYSGAFGQTSVSTHQVSGTVTIGIARNPVSGTLYVTGAGSDALMEVDPSNGSVLRRWEPVISDQMYDVAVSPDGEQVYVAGSVGTLYVISAASLTQINEFNSGASYIHLLAHPTLPLVYASGQGIAREVNVETGAERTFATPSAQATALAISGDRLFIGGEAGTMGVVDLATGNVTTHEVPGCAIYDVAAAPDGNRLLVTCSLNGIAKILDAESLVSLATINTGGIPRRVAISQDGGAAVIANESGWFHHIR